MHTPGPWTACFAVAGPILDGALLGWHISAPELGSSDPVCERRDGFDRSQRTDEEERANARLIAAAPELYQALTAAVEIIDKWIEPETMGVVRSGDGVLGHYLRDEYLMNFRAALSKVSQQQGSGTTGTPHAQGQQNEGAES